MFACRTCTLHRREFLRILINRRLLVSSLISNVEIALNIVVLTSRRASSPSFPGSVVLGARLLPDSVFSRVRSFPELKYRTQSFIHFGLCCASIEPRNDPARDRTGISWARHFLDLYKSNID